MYNVDILITHDSPLWEENLPHTETLIRRVLNTTMNYFPSYPPADYEFSVYLSHDTKVQELNKVYRGKDRPTNVLSFPMIVWEEFNLMQENIMAGDLVFGYETIAQEATQEGKSFDDHLAHLIIHGTLHLLGYDHQTDAEAEKMEAIEIEIMNVLGLSNPYLITEA